MDAAVGAAGHGQRDRLAQHRRQRRAQLTGDGPLARLVGPAGERSTVIFQG
jgi:hypothetical protein